MYEVRILINGNHGEIVKVRKYFSTYYQALRNFLFYVECSCDFSLSVRSVTLFSGQKSIKLFQNY